MVKEQAHATWRRKGNREKRASKYAVMFGRLKGPPLNVHMHNISVLRSYHAMINATQVLDIENHYLPSEMYARFRHQKPLFAI